MGKKKVAGIPQPKRAASAPKPVKAAADASPSKTVKKVKSAAKATTAPHPPYLEMVVAAVEALKERSGSSRQAILKYIMATYSVGANPKICNSHLKQALKRGLASEMLKNAKNVKGAAGSFRIADKKAAAPKKAAPAATKSVKVSPKKATATKKTKPAASPAKKAAAAKKTKVVKKAAAAAPKTVKAAAPVKAAPKAAKAAPQSCCSQESSQITGEEGTGGFAGQ